MGIAVQAGVLLPVNVVIASDASRIADLIFVADGNGVIHACFSDPASVQGQ